MQFALSFHPHKLLFFTHYNDEIARSHTIIVKLPRLTRGDGLMSSEIVFFVEENVKEKGCARNTRKQKTIYFAKSLSKIFSLVSVFIGLTCTTSIPMFKTRRDWRRFQV